MHNEKSLEILVMIMYKEKVMGSTFKPSNMGYYSFTCGTFKCVSTVGEKIESTMHMMKFLFYGKQKEFDDEHFKICKQILYTLESVVKACKFYSGYKEKILDKPIPVKKMQIDSIMDFQSNQYVYNAFKEKLKNKKTSQLQKLIDLIKSQDCFREYFDSVDKKIRFAQEPKIENIYFKDERYLKFMYEFVSIMESIVKERQADFEEAWRQSAEK